MMTTLHPFIVHFPIALLFVAGLFDFYGAARNHEQATKTAFILQIISAVSAILAAFSGNLAETTIRAQDVLTSTISHSLDRHVAIGNAAVWVIILTVSIRVFAVLEKKSWAVKGWIFPIISLGLAVLIIFTGLYGGQLSHDILEYFINN